MVDDPYTLLGVSRDATEEELRQAWRRSARQWHPDLAGDDPLAEARFVAIGRAWALLSDPLKRAFYDAFGKDPDALGLDADTLRAALIQHRQAARAPRVQHHRSDCPYCGGTGWRPGGRACDCDAHGVAPQPPTPDWDPTTHKTSRRMRMTRQKTRSASQRLRLRDK